jgi:hypothetical protein
VFFAPRELDGIVGKARLTSDTLVPDELVDELVRMEVDAVAKSPAHVGSQLLV